MEKSLKKSVSQGHISKNIKQNISTEFLLPCLKIREEVKSKFYQSGFVNTYMFWDKHKGNCGDFIPLYLLFEPGIFTVEFYKFSQTLERNQNYVETVDNSDGSVVFVFRIPKRFIADYTVFKEGKYSKFSQEFKECFPLTRYMLDNKGAYMRDTTGKFITENTMFYHIFYKTDYMKELVRETYGHDIDLPDELYEKYRPERETLNH